MKESKVEKLIYGFYRRKYNNVLKKLDDGNITNLRKNVKILIVDDEKFEIIDMLKTREYSVYYKTDIEYIIDAEPYDIVILDIKGVANTFGSTYQGLGYAIEVKKKYPHKIIACYSTIADPKYSQELDKIDGFINKDLDIDRWSDKIDDYIRKYASIDYHWDLIKKRLSQINLDADTISRIERLFRDSFKNDEFDMLKNNLMENINNVKITLDILNILTKIICLFI